jgi:hypothetical protein
VLVGEVYWNDGDDDDDDNELVEEEEWCTRSSLI